MSLFEWLRGLFGPKKSTPPPPPPPVADAGLTDEVIRLINLERTCRGLNALVRHPRLAPVSQAWAEAMARAGAQGHGNFQGRIASVLPNTAAGEDVAEGGDPAQAVRAWMSDRPHRANVLGDWTVIGVGVARATGPVAASYWCADFDKTDRPEGARP